MKLSLDNDGNFLFDGKICTDDRIDDIRDFVNNANEAFAAINQWCLRAEGVDYSYRVGYDQFKEIAKKAGYCNDGAANCIDNPETTANPDPYSIAFTNYTEGETVKSYWYDSQGNRHPV